MLVNFDNKITKNKIDTFVECRGIKVDSILDFTNTLKRNPEFSVYRISYPGDRDTAFEIHRLAVKNYTDNVSKIGNVSLAGGGKVRDISFDDFPVYWLSDISLKHAQVSVLKNFYYFVELLKEGKSFAGTGELILAIPSHEYYFQDFFSKKLRCDFNLQVRFLDEDAASIHATWGTRAFLKNVVVQYRKANTARKLYLKTKKQNDASNSIFTFPFSTWDQNAKHDYVFSELNEHINSVSDCNYIPMLLSLPDLTNLKKWEEKWDVGLLKKFPRYLDLFVFVFRLYRFIKTIDSLEIEKTDGSQTAVDSGILKKELRDLAFINYGFLFYYVWLKKYFKSVNGRRNFFYQDEFYLSGRIISHAVKQSKNEVINAFGVQHGLFFSGHTVYTITDHEIQGNNSMPIPEKFIVWGDFFKTEFLKNNSLKDDYVVVAGNLKYTRKEKSDKLAADSKLLLWCATTESDNLQMFEVFKEKITDLKDYTLLIRCHPLFQLTDKIKTLLESNNVKNYSFSESNDLFHDIKRSKVMISSNASTTFIDGLLSKIPVININLPDYLFDPVESENLYNVKNGKEFSIAFGSLVNTNFKFFENSSSTFNSSVESWNKLICIQ